MSSKILSKDAAALATPMVWPVTGPAQPRRLARDTRAEDAPPVPPQDVLAELDRRVAMAREAGFRDGEAAGMEKSAQRLDPLLIRLSQTVEQLAGQRVRVRREAEEDVVKLALTIARRILHREISIDPDALLGLVKAALGRLEGREVHRVRMNPDDLAAVKVRLPAGRKIEFAADASLERGAAIFETSRGVLDASVETQLAEIERGFADLVRKA